MLPDLSLFRVAPHPRIAVSEESTIALTYDDCPHFVTVVDSGPGAMRSTCLGCGFSLVILSPRDGGPEA